jgi:hypothetical protein
VLVSLSENAGNTAEECKRKGKPGKTGHDKVKLNEPAKLGDFVYLRSPNP